MIIPVILSGGSGTRLWPLSTPARPKQFLPLLGEESLFEDTLERVCDRSKYGPPIVVGNAAHENLLREGLGSRSNATLVLEPVARNTAVAITIAALIALARDPEAILLVMPSDHRIGNDAAFHDAVTQGLHAADRDLLVTFGIHPTAPSTGYGYLQAGESLPDFTAVQSVDRFKEKPDDQAAMAMLAAGGHYWNGGIFLFKAASFLSECQTLAPDVYRCGARSLSTADLTGDTIRPDGAVLAECPDISIDYAVMERSDAVAMVALDADWSDVGSWDALAEIGGSGDRPAPLSHDSSNCFVKVDGPQIALLGVHDLIVVGDGERIAIVRKGRSQDIKRLAALAAND